MKILVSACLLGIDCKYNGKNNKNDKIIELLKDHELIPVCPEIMGGFQHQEFRQKYIKTKLSQKMAKMLQNNTKRCRRDTKNCKVI